MIDGDSKWKRREFLQAAAGVPSLVMVAETVALAVPPETAPSEKLTSPDVSGNYNANGSDPQAGDFDRFGNAATALREYWERFGHHFPAARRDVLGQAIHQLIVVGWDDKGGGATHDEVALSIAQTALAKILPILDWDPETVRLSLGNVAEPMILRRHFASGTGALLLRIDQPGIIADTTPEFIVREMDLAAGDVPEIHIPPGRTGYLILYFENVPSGTGRFHIRVSRDDLAAEALLIAEVPRSGRLSVRILDEGGRVVPAIAGLYASDRQIVVPKEAVSFDESGAAYRRGRLRPYAQPRYWPGDGRWGRAFIVGGEFSIAAPSGEYTLVVGKGTEYLPVTTPVVIPADGDASATVVLRRWIDMPARGWISGDGHIHYARPVTAANIPLMTWLQAEDVHIGNVLGMGDQQATYFGQYAYGGKGRVSSGPYSIVPGQEDPRSDFGHVLAWNLQAPVRDKTRYRLYKLVLDGAHKQGGMAGYAHVYQPPRNAYWVRRDMSLHVPRNKVDFVEIAELGDAGDALYHEFLNLGFRLTATAGSDVPWGDSIGVSRLYAFTGGSTDPDVWFRAVREGHTFITTGPMLTLTVNGRIPGDMLQIDAGESVEIEATAEGGNVLPRFLEIVAQGDVIRAAPEPSADAQKISVRFKYCAVRSTWISARCAGALTTPVYLSAGGRRFWKLESVPFLVAARLRDLTDIERFVAEAVNGRARDVLDLEAFRRQAPELLEEVSAVRKHYQRMLEEAREEMRG